MFKRTSVRYCPGSYPPELLELFDPNTTNQDTFAPCVVCSWWHVELAFWNHLNETPTGISQTTNQQFHYAFKDACFPSPRWSLVVYFHPPSAGSFGVSKSAFDVIKALTVEFRWHPRAFASHLRTQGTWSMYCNHMNILKNVRHNTHQYSARIEFFRSFPKQKRYDATSWSWLAKTIRCVLRPMRPEYRSKWRTPAAMLVEMVAEINQWRKWRK